MNPTNTTSSFSNREKMRRNPFNRRNNRSISLRRLYISRLYSQGSIRVRNGGTTGSYPSAKASCRVASPSLRAVHDQRGTLVLLTKAIQQLTSFRSVVGPCPGESENVMAVRASAATI